MGDFGDKFRKAREKKELSLDDVSNVTKISPRMLQAIEEEKFDRLPGGVFNKGFIRAYAKHLGLNAEEAVSDYLACLRQAQVDAHEVWEPHQPTPARPATPVKTADTPPAKPSAKPQPAPQVEELPDLQLPRAKDVRPPSRGFVQDPSSGIPRRLVAVAAIVVVLAVLLWVRHSRSAHANAAKPTDAPAMMPSTPSSVEPATPVAANRANTTLDSGSVSKPVPTSQASGLQKSHPENDDVTVKDVVVKNDVTIRTFDHKAAPTTKNVTSLTLVIRATENSWISVTADGQLVTQETLIAPANTSIHATREIVAKVGNSAGITFLWNGEELPAQGAESEVKTLVFDASGMRVLPTSQSSTLNQ